VPSNIAEGKGHRSNPEFVRFLYHARGSLLEVETQIMLAARFHYIDAERERSVLRQTATVGRSLNGLIKALTKTSKPLGALDDDVPGTDNLRTTND
jgi:four helix bundle protein